MKKVDYIDEKFNVAKYVFGYICRGIILHGYLPSATKLRQGNVFTPVCHSVQGGCLPQCMLGYTPPSQEAYPPKAHTPRRPLQRTVSILLECFLVLHLNYLLLRFIGITSSNSSVNYCRNNRKA